MAEIEQKDLEQMRARIEEITEILTIFQEDEDSMAEPHLKLKWTGFNWDTPYRRICLKFDLIHFSAGKGMAFLADSINSNIKLTRNVLNDPSPRPYSDCKIFYVKNEDGTENKNKHFKIFDNKGDTLMQEIGNKEVFARPYRLEYTIKLTS
jgi:hypothetical protein